jgi:serine/threonine protein kinase
VQLALDLASALSFAHRQRIVHRDVKPANVLHAGDNRWKLADFGIARMPDSDLTQVGIFMGTPGYSPPEAIREGRYTPQADVFAWGAVFYEVLSGRIPYEGPDTKTTNGYVVQGNAPVPTRHDPSIPEPLATVTMTALQPSDRTRFKDASEAEQALREAWDRCLTQGLVHPAVLAMEEQSHDKVTSRMHEPRNLPSRPLAVPALPSDSAELTAVDDHMHLKPLTIESRKPQRVTDDDPTMLQVRVEELRGKGDATTRGVAPERTDRPSGKAKALSIENVPVTLGSGGRPRLDDAAPTQNDESKIDTSMIGRDEIRPASRLPMIVGLVVVTIVAALVSLYIGGVLGL